MHDVVQLFAEDRATLERYAADARKALRPGGSLWMSYLNPAALRRILFSRRTSNG